MQAKAKRRRQERGCVEVPREPGVTIGREGTPGNGASFYASLVHGEVSRQDKSRQRR